MKILKTLSFSLLLTASVLSNAIAGNPISNVVSLEFPVKTVFIKHPNADNADKFFSTTKIVNFEIYKVGTKEDLAKIISTLKADPSVETAFEGVLTGDYQAVTLVVKTEKNKGWFMSEFKKAGLNTIKINNGAVVDVEKL